MSAPTLPPTKVPAVHQQGLASPDHAAFVARLGQISGP